MTAMHLMNSRVIALVRGVPKSFAKAVIDEKSAAALGGKAIDWALASKQHAGYVDALSKIVDSVEALPALEAHPDCPFVEDTVVYARGIAVTLRQGTIPE